jgi:hypothetical protein
LDKAIFENTVESWSSVSAHLKKKKKTKKKMIPHKPISLFKPFQSLKSKLILSHNQVQRNMHKTEHVMETCLHHYLIPVICKEM